VKKKNCSFCSLSIKLKESQMKSPRFDPCQLLSSFDGRKRLEQPVNARCWPELVASGQSNKWAYHRMELYPLWEVQSSCQQQLKRGDICEVHP
jgi:hypothetical protein